MVNANVLLLTVIFGVSIVLQAETVHAEDEFDIFRWFSDVLNWILPSQRAAEPLESEGIAQSEQEKITIIEPEEAVEHREKSAYPPETAEIPEEAPETDYEEQFIMEKTREKIIPRRVIDLTKTFPENEIADIEMELGALYEGTSQPNIFMIITPDIFYYNYAYQQAVDYAADNNADCVIIARMADEGAVSFLVVDCTLSGSEFQEALENYQEGNGIEVAKEVFLRTAEIIDGLEKRNDEIKDNDYEYFLKVWNSNDYSVIPVSSSTETYAFQANAVLKKAESLNPRNPEAKYFFENVKSRFSTTPEALFDEKLNTGLLYWLRPLIPSILKPVSYEFEYRNWENSVWREGTKEITNFKKGDFTVQVPSGSFCKVTVVNGPFYGRRAGIGIDPNLVDMARIDTKILEQMKQETVYIDPQYREMLKKDGREPKITYIYDVKERQAKCGSPNKITVGTGSDCFLAGENTCAVIVTAGIRPRITDSYLFSIEYIDKNEVASPEILRQKIQTFIRAIYTAADEANKNDFGVSITPEELYIISIGEGLRWYIEQDYVRKPNTVVSRHLTGINYIDFDYLKKHNFLRREVSFYGRDKGSFENIQDALEALSALIASSKNDFLRDLKNLGVDKSQVTRKQVNFWTYYYFNCGKGCGFKQLRKFVDNGRLSDADFINAVAGETVQNGKNARHNSIIRAVMMEFMYDSGILAKEELSDERA